MSNPILSKFKSIPTKLRSIVVAWKPGVVRGVGVAGREKVSAVNATRYQLEAVNEETSSDRLIELAQISTLLAQLVAKNPIAPPELLRKLAYSSDATIRQNVAANPNTPTEVLLKLGAKFPEQLLGNPALPLLCLENLNILDQIFQIDTLSKLKLDTQTPKEILEKLVHSKYPQIAQSAQLHVNWAGEMTSGWDEAALEMMQTIGKPSTFIYIFGGYLLERGLISVFLSEKLKLQAISGLDSGSIRWSLAQKPNTPVHLLEQLAQDDDKYVRLGVARNPNTPVQLLVQLAQDDDKYVREGVARNPNTPVQLLVQLAQNDDKSVREEVAKNPNTPVQLLVQLAQDDDKSMRKGVASNPSSPAQLLEQLAQDNDESVRKEVASNPSSPAQLLEQLAQDNDESVRWEAAKNPNIPVQLLVQLAQGNDESVHWGVLVNPNSPVQLLKQLAQDQDAGVRKWAAWNPNTPVQLLEQLAQDQDAGVRICVVRNPNTPVQLLEQLAQDNNEYVRKCVARNPNTPVQVLEQFVQDVPYDLDGMYDRCYSSDSTHGNLFSNPNFPIKLLLEVIPQYDLPEFPFILTPSLSRIIVLLHSQTPQEVLAENSRSLVWLERYAVAQNTNTPPNILKALAQDANRIVRAAAKANLQRRNHKP